MTPSIRRTLLFRCGSGIGALFGILSISVYFMVRHGLYEEIDDSLRETASILANQMEYEKGAIIFEWQEGIGTNGGITDQALFQYWNRSAGTTTRSPALGNANLPSFSGSNGKPLLQTVGIPGRMENARAIGMTIFPYALPEESLELAKNGTTFDAGLYPHTLVVARDLQPALEILARLAILLSIGTIVMLGVGFLLIGRAIRSSLAPIGTLTREVRSRTGKASDVPVVLPHNLPIELAPLAKSFDELLGRVAAIRIRERDFIRHAAHELRTPIAALSSVTELALSRQRSAEEYAAHLKSCSETSSQLNGLVQRIAALARVGAQGSPAHYEELDLRETFEKCIEGFSKRLEQRAISVDPSGDRKEISIHGDPILLRLIVNNLLDNAISYAPEGSRIEVEVESGNGISLLSMTNEASGLPGNLERLFEPLFRRDPSRTSTDESHHLGIGLTLSQDAAVAMGWRLSAMHKEEGRVCFTLSIPMTSAQQDEIIGH